MSYEKTKKRTWAFIAVVVAIILALAAVVGVGSYYGWFDKQSDVVAENPDTADDTKEPDDTDDSQTSDTTDVTEEAVNPYDAGAEADFYYNGKAMYCDFVYYLYFSETYGSSQAESCYYINSSGEEVYIYTAEDIENGLSPIIRTTSAGDPGCVEDGYSVAVVYGEDGNLYNFNVKHNHYYSNGKCVYCGTAEE